MEAGKKRLNGDTQREANTDEVKSLRNENDTLKKLLAELYLEKEMIKKSQGG
jgi:transposase